MSQWQFVGSSGGRAGLAVELMMKDRLRAAVRTLAEFQTALTVGLHAIAVAGVQQAKDAQAGPKPWSEFDLVSLG